MKVVFFIFFIALIPTLILPGEAYRILGVFSHNGKSHFMMYEKLLKGLAERGHQVDVVSHFPLKKPFPNYNQIANLAGTLPTMQNNVTYDFVTEFRKASVVPFVATTLGGQLCDLMDEPKLKKLIKNPPKDPPYDVLIVDVFGATCYLALGHHFNVPIVGAVSSAMWPWANDLIANPDNPAYIADVFTDLRGKMNFWERVWNTLQLMQHKWEFSHYNAYQNAKIKKYIGPDAQGLREAERSISLILTNSHHSLNGVRPYTTGVVEVGGLHISEDVEPLPNDLKVWLNDSKDGFVYISFGSMARIESFPTETLRALYASVAKLSPIRVLMRIAKPDELLPGLPDNVRTFSWIPQVAVLKHKYIRAFMTHGGLMGTQEAVYCGVPMIGVPLFADQTQNINLYIEKKTAVALHFQHLTEEKLDAAFNTVLKNSSYMKAAKKLSAEFRDRPMSALDTAVFWVEYVVRHGGTNLRSPAMDLTWWQIALIDVYGVLFLAAVLVIYLLQVIIVKLLTLGAKIAIKGVKDSKKLKST